MKHYYYVTERDNVIMIAAKKKPSIKSMPRSGTWVVKEFHDGGWHIPCFPEIVWGTVKKLRYIGSLEIKSRRNSNG